MESPNKIKHFQKKALPFSTCPQCKGSDVLVIPGSPNYYSCRDKNCPSNKPPDKIPEEVKK